jgi:hypothetical protein
MLRHYWNGKCLSAKPVHSAPLNKTDFPFGENPLRNFNGPWLAVSGKLINAVDGILDTHSLDTVISSEIQCRKHIFMLLHVLHEN